MCAPDAERIEEANGIGGHCIQRVGRAHRQAQPGGRKRGDQIRLPADANLRRQSAIAVVKPDDAESPLDQPVAERVGPRHELHAETHDEQYRRRGGIAERFVLDRDAVGRDCSHVSARQQLVRNSLIAFAPHYFIMSQRHHSIKGIPELAACSSNVRPMIRCRVENR